jgi:hypothetical protein
MTVFGSIGLRAGKVFIVTQPFRLKVIILMLNDTYMKIAIWSLLLCFVLSSCQDETDSLIWDYELLPGSWVTSSVKYDSSGVKVTRIIDYDLLEIQKDLTYKIFYKTEHSHPIENGYVRIKSQTSSHLELYFEAHYPSYSSFAGSHIFSPGNVTLIRLTSEELVFRDVENEYFSQREYYFSRK